MIFIFSLLWPLVMIVLVVTASPVVILFGPPLWAFQSTVHTYGGNAALFAALLTAGYTWLILKAVHGAVWLVLLLIVVPWLIGKVMLAGRPQKE